MRDLYDRQTSLKLNPVPSAIVVGLGGTGSWVALFLAMSGCENLCLFDFDQVEASNLNRIPFPPEGSIGQTKTAAVKQLIETLRPECFITTFGKATAFSLAQADGEFFFDCTDRQDTQRQMFEWAKQYSRNYIRVGYDGTHFTIADFVPTWRTGPARTGYEITPSWVVPAALAACLGVAKAMFCPELNISGDIKNLEVKDNVQGK